MTQPLPARPGNSVDDIDTPALVVDLDPFERNLDLMANAVRGAGVALRPHAKSHKCPDIARAQIERGAVGICCQKVGEADAFVTAGIRDVLVTNEIVGAAKLARLAALAHRANVGVLVDDAANVRHLGAAARAAGVTLDALVEIDVGAHRCGVLPGAPAVELAQAIARTPALRFRGIHAYHGAAQHLRAPEERRAAIALASQARGGNEGRDRGRRHRLSGRHRRRHRHVAARARQRRVHRNPARLVHLHGCRLPPQCARAGPAPLRAEPVRACVRDERAGARARGRRRGIEGLRFRFGPAAGVRRARTRVRQGIGRAWRAGRLARDRPAGSSATGCGSSPAIAIRRSTCTTGSSACAARVSSACGPLPREARLVESSGRQGHDPPRRAQHRGKTRVAVVGDRQGAVEPERSQRGAD